MSRSSGNLEKLFNQTFPQTKSFTSSHSFSSKGGTYPPRGLHSSPRHQHIDQDNLNIIQNKPKTLRKNRKGKIPNRLVLNDETDFLCLTPSGSASAQLSSSTFSFPTERFGKGLSLSDSAITTKGPSEILDYLYLGSEADAKDVHKLKQQNISHIITLQKPSLEQYHQKTYPDYANQFKYKHFQIMDSNDANILQHIDEAICFIEEAKQCGKKVLVHCQAGISRSATICMAYLMKTDKNINGDFDSAFKYLKTKRSIIAPNLSFLGQLKEYERNLAICNNRYEVVRS